MRNRFMWLIIFAVSIAAGIAGIFYLAGKVRQCGLSSRILSFAAVIAAVAVLCFVLDVTNAIVIVVHVTVFLLAGDAVSLILRRFLPGAYRPVIADAVALAACVIYLCVGWYLMHGLWQTDYFLETDKQTGKICVAHIADSHVGCGFSGEGFGQRLSKIQEQNPDILVITGDFVDDGTTKQDMIDACAALGTFRAKYGVFFCFGNHDRGYYADERRGYGEAELVSELEKNGVTILRDEARLIDGRFYVIGRDDSDYGRSERLGMDELMEGLDRDRYMIVLDHQPTDYDAEAASGADLVLSGHTHGGQLFPLEYIQPLISKNNNVRGYERRGGTDFIVTDGISDWAVKFRTGCRSEYNLIHITEKRKGMQ